MLQHLILHHNMKYIPLSRTIWICNQWFHLLAHYLFWVRNTFYNTLAWLTEGLKSSVCSDYQIDCPTHTNPYSTLSSSPSLVLPSLPLPLPMSFPSPTHHIWSIIHHLFFMVTYRYFTCSFTRNKKPFLTACCYPLFYGSKTRNLSL